MGMSASSEAVCNARDTNQKQEQKQTCLGFLVAIDVEEPWKAVRVLALLKATGEGSQFAL